ncbi:enterobactin transporter EntS [Ancylobacter sonchi]|uniref:enterobactin transporter EntS n=1 Tax=Ancylobacter sonchi TaxID=1937790 RepID=UPI001BD379A7|nr:enterobactin transporter EntS [Ancylobacter sonchi]MBS7532386.1 enterobactin transporter EntS [Ancylobacter sonchi]
MSARLFVDISLLRRNAYFRNLLIARTISLMSLGMLTVSVPVQVYEMTGSSVQVGLVAALDGLGMFLGLLLGGVLSDLHDRRRLILFARSICGIGFLGLAANSLLETPSLIAIYGLAFWDGFFGALGVAALMAAMPFIAGRENLMQAGALGMLATRCATIVSPALGGMVIAFAGLGWNYGIAAAGTLATVLTLLSLPRMVPERPEVTHPLRMMGEAFGFLFRHRKLLMVFAIGTLLTITTSIRILFPALVTNTFGGGALEIGFMYSAVPVGATLGALLSGWARGLNRPELTMSGLCVLAFACVVALGAAGHIAAAMPVLVVYGYATAIANLLQYTIIQDHTPDAYLGRINSLWAAQDVTGDSIGAVGIGALAQLLPGAGVMLLGAAALGLGGLFTLGFHAMGRADVEPALPASRPVAEEG